MIAPPPMELGAWVPDPNLVSASVELAHSYNSVAREMGILFADAGTWNIPLAFDGVHFTEEGHTAFANGLYQYLQKGVFPL